jgi:hypothetical protein
MEKFKNKFKKESPRLKNRDYGAPGFYFVTICTLNRKHYFGDVAHVETYRASMKALSGRTNCSDVDIISNAILLNGWGF